MIKSSRGGSQKESMLRFAKEKVPCTMYFFFEINKARDQNSIKVVSDISFKRKYIHMIKNSCGGSQ